MTVPESLSPHSRVEDRQLQMARVSEEMPARPAASKREEEDTGPELVRGKAPGIGTEVAFTAAARKEEERRREFTGSRVTVVERGGFLSALVPVPCQGVCFNLFCFGLSFLNLPSFFF